jgi:hypothetical protein
LNLEESNPHQQDSAGYTLKGYLFQNAENHEKPSILPLRINHSNIFRIKEYADSRQGHKQVQRHN